MMYSLRTKLTSVFVLLGLVPVVVLGVVAYRAVTQSGLAAASDLSVALISRERAALEQFVDNQTAALFEFRLGYSVKSVPSREDQVVLLEKLLEENEYVIEASFAHTTGEVLAKVSRVQNLGAIDEANVYANVRNLESFSQARKGTTYYGPVYQTLEGPHMSVAAPVRNSGGDIVMVAMGEVSLAPLVASVADARLGKTGYLYVVDSDGVIVASRDASMLGKDVGSDSWTREVLAGNAKNGLGKDDRRTGLFGEEVLAAGQSTPKFGNGAVVAEWPVADALATSRQLQRNIAGFAAVGVIAVFVLAWLVGRKILVPLQQLKLGAETIGSGKLDYKINISTGDEIEMLGSVFNRMGTDLQKLEQLKMMKVKAEALAASLKKEIELSKIKEDFIKNTSHQLRTPLSIIRWNRDMLGQTKIDKDQKQMVEAMGAGMEELNVIVRDLIAVSDFGFNFKNSVWKEIDVAKLVEKMVGNHASNIEAKRIVVVKNIPKDVPRLFGNPLGIETLFDNLIDNAVTYTPEGGTITVGVSVRKTNFEFSIQDTGIGIPEKEQQSLFQQFFRATNAISMKNVGSGLGLVICKNIAEGHGGSIRFESKSGSGTTFFVSLPLKKV